MSKDSLTKKARKYNSFRIIAVTVFITFVAVGALYSVQTYNNPSIEGKWQSLETGEVVEFTKDGQVLLNDTGYIPEYQVVGNNQMEYTIDDKQFTMEYTLEGRTLKWGLLGQPLEEFKRK